MEPVAGIADIYGVCASFANLGDWLMWSVVPSVIILGLVAITAVRLALSRTSPAEARADRETAATILGIATAIQSMHFVEEWTTDFHIRFPALLGLDPMPLSFFVSFNLMWIAIWIISVPFLRLRRRAAFFAAWFLAIAGVLNGVAHPMMALASGGYFPGLITSPLIGIAGIILSQRLKRATVGPARVT